MIFNMGELFCGPGGIALGAKMADIGDPDWKIIHAWANDFDKSTCETYIKNICPHDPNSVICKDVHTLDFRKLSSINALSFGAPCNDFSVVGEQKGFDGNYGPLYSYGVKALEKFHPYWFMFENVSGIRSANSGKALKVIQNDMIKAGYNLFPNLYYFERYGVPQARHRMIIVGIRKDQNLEFKIPSYDDYEMKTCRDAIEHPPIPSNAANNELTRHTNKVIERLKYIRPGENAWTADIPEGLRLNVQGAKLSQVYRRLDPNKPAYTITGSGGGGTHVYHWDEPRALTNRERARLQTFPDDYIFVGSKESVRKQIGMAVPPAGAKIIFEAILKTFAGIPYKSVAPIWAD